MNIDYIDICDQYISLFLQSILTIFLFIIPAVLISFLSIPKKYKVELLDFVLILPYIYPCK